MITTDSDEHAERLRVRRLHGITRDAWKRYTSEGTWYYEVAYPGYKYNMTDIQAALGLQQLRKCDMFHGIRSYYAGLYQLGLSDLPELKLPQVAPGTQHSWHLYVIQLDLEGLTIDRAAFIDLLRKEGIGVERPLHPASRPPVLPGHVRLQGPGLPERPVRLRARGLLAVLRADDRGRGVGSDPGCSPHHRKSPSREPVMIKRTCDIVLSALGLAVLSPLLLLLAVLVKLDSRGPVFFRQRRIGKDGHPFWIVKFRTMVDNAYTLGSRLTHKHDPRITRVGQVLRWLKLDELPQLWNVLKGDMSLVGPRPEDPHFVHMYTPEQRAVLSVRPGVVGPNQILGRNEIEKYPDDCIDTERYYVEHIMPEKLATDLEYVRTCGFLGDLRLIAAGLGATLFGAFQAKFLHLNQRRLLLLLFDTLASLAVYHLSFGLKLDRSHPEAFQYALMMSVLILVVRPPLFLYFGLYQNILRYVGASEFLAIGRAVTVGSVVISALAFFLGYQQHSRQVLLMDWGLLIVVLFGVRIAMKTWLAYHPLGRDDEPRKNVLIVGADDTGEHLASALVNLKAPSYRPIGFLDDDPAKRGAIINGIRVLGRTHDLPVVAAIERVDLVVILFAKGTSGALRTSIDYCRAHNLQYRLLPTLDRLLDGDLIMPELRELGLNQTEALDGRDGDAAAAAIGDGGDQNGSPAGLAEGRGETPCGPSSLRAARTAGAGDRGRGVHRLTRGPQAPGERAARPGRGQLPLRRPRPA